MPSAMENSCGEPTVNMFSLEWGVSYENEANAQAYSGGLSGLSPLLHLQYPSICAETATPSNADERRENPPGLESEVRRH